MHCGIYLVMYKLITLLKDKTVEIFLKNWKPITDFWHERENNELMSCGFEE